jgi:hypothetical protein
LGLYAEDQADQYGQGQSDDIADWKIDQMKHKVEIWWHPAHVDLLVCLLPDSHIQQCEYIDKPDCQHLFFLLFLKYAARNILAQIPQKASISLDFLCFR